MNAAQCPYFPQPPTTSQGGALVAVVRGALGPQLEKTIKEQLEYEHQVLEGKAERKQVGVASVLFRLLSMPSAL